MLFIFQSSLLKIVLSKDIIHKCFYFAAENSLTGCCIPYFFLKGQVHVYRQAAEADNPIIQNFDVNRKLILLFSFR